MAIYTCDKCGMSVGRMTCGRCDKDLVNDSIDVDGRAVQVTKCPDGHGMVKSPACCGQDMACTV